MKGNQGNALFLILIAVALFAALSYAVTQSGRGGGNTDREETRLAIAEMMQYTATIQNAIQKLKLVNGCQDDQFSFDHSGWSISYFNHFSPVDESCHIFEPEGGGVTFQDVPDVINDLNVEYGVVSSTRIFNVGSNSTTNFEGIDLIMFAHVPRDMCMAINDIEGITNPSGNPPAVTPGPFNIESPPGAPELYATTCCAKNTNGPYMNAVMAGQSAGNAPEIAGKMTGCFLSTSLDPDAYLFYQVLLAR